MGLETARTIAELDETNPLGSDQVKFGDDHLRMIKNVLKDDLAWLWNQTRLYSFQAGAVVTSTDILYDEASFKFYHWNGPYSGGNYTVAAGSTPASAGGIGPTAWVDVGQGTFKEFLASDQGYGFIGGTPAPVEVDLSGLEEKKEADHLGVANTSLFSVLMGRSNVLILGDSITAGVGSSVPQFAYAHLLGQSLANFWEGGYGYPIHRNRENGTAVYGYTGTPVNAGLAKDAISLAPGQAVVFCPSETIAYGGYIIGGASTVGAVLQLQINGTTVASYTVTAAAHQEFFLNPPQSPYTSASDTVQVVASGGTIVISGAAPFHEGQGHKLVASNNSSPLCITCGASGESFNYFNSNATLIAAMLDSFFAAGNPAVVFLAIGTNSIYNNVQAQTPAQYVTSLQTLVNSITALRSDTSFIYTIPPKANEAMWPVIKPGYTYEDYADLLKSTFAGQDLIDLNLPRIHYADGVHPSAIGHEALAKHWCKFLGIPFNPNMPAVNKCAKLVGASPVTITDGQVSRDEHGVIRMCGMVFPNGAAGNLITTVNNNFRPSIQRLFMVPLHSASVYGYGIITINTNGEVRLVYNSLVWINMYLDGISYVA